MEKIIESIPEARLLLMSLRSVGYTEETAVADIIDNSISAGANEIKIFFDWIKQRILIIDNGIGMDSDSLIKNMRIGSADPHEIRASTDLGRFGMGMKTAAFIRETAYCGYKRKRDLLKCYLGSGCSA